MLILASGAFAHARALATEMRVDVGRMRANVDLTQGLIVSEAVALALAEHVGVGRAHAIVERAATAAVETKQPLLDVLAVDPAVTEHLEPDALARLLDPARYTGEAGAVVDRVVARTARLAPSAKERP